MVLDSFGGLGDSGVGVSRRILPGIGESQKGGFWHPWPRWTLVDMDPKYNKKHKMKVFLWAGWSSVESSDRSLESPFLETGHGPEPPSQGESWLTET